MGILKSARHETFAQAWARTKSATEACLEIKMDPRNSTRLTKNDEIRRRVDELLGVGAERTIVTIESLIREADEIQRAAKAAKQHSAAILALTAKAKLAGLWVERSVNGNTNVVYAISDEPMPIEEWVAKFTKDN
jgi:hypothetical protein